MFAGVFVFVFVFETPEKNVFVFVFVFDKTYLTPALPIRGCLFNEHYRKTSNISRTLVCNKIVDYSDVVGASPVGAAPTTSSYLT